MAAVVTKERIKKEIDRLSDVEVEKLYLYLSSLKKDKIKPSTIRVLKLEGKLDGKDIRSVAYE